MSLPRMWYTCAIKFDLSYNNQGDMQPCCVEQNAGMNPTQFKELTGGAPRKFLIPLLEYFDSKNVTLRVGDVRKLRKG